jgi:AraC-like DNA-binding protein
MRLHAHHSAPDRVAAPDGVARLRFWRPFPREAADVICGEGAVADLPIHTLEALRITLPASRFVAVDGQRGAAAMRPGLIHLTAPLALHGVRSLDGVPCAMRVLLVGPAMLKGLGERLSRALCDASDPGRVVEDADLFAELWALAGEMRGPAVALSCAARLLRCLERLLAGLPPLTASRRPARQPDGVNRVCDHLRAHAAESISLDELARVAGLSKFYLLRAFRRAHGLTPHAYQMQLRLAHAWRFIGEGRPLSRTTYDAGFADQSHLTRRFAALFGVTPARHARQLAVPPGASSLGALGDFHASAPSSAA